MTLCHTSSTEALSMAEGMAAVLERGIQESFKTTQTTLKVLPTPPKHVPVDSIPTSSTRDTSRHVRLSLNRKAISTKSIRQRKRHRSEMSKLEPDLLEEFNRDHRGEWVYDTKHMYIRVRRAERKCRSTPTVTAMRSMLIQSIQLSLPKFDPTITGDDRFSAEKASTILVDPSFRVMTSKIFQSLLDQYDEEHCMRKPQLLYEIRSKNNDCAKESNA